MIDRRTERHLTSTNESRIFASDQPTPLQRVHGSSPWRCTQTSRSDRLPVWPVSFLRRSSRRLVDENSSGEGPRWLGHRSRSAAMARSSSPAAGASGSLVAGTEISTGRPLARGRPTVSRLDLYSAATEARIAALRAQLDGLTTLAQELKSLARRLPIRLRQQRGSRLRTPRTEREPTTCASERLPRQRAAFRLRRRGSCEAGRSTWTPALELLAIGLPSRGHACRARPSITDRTGGPPSSGSGRHTKRARSPSTSIRAPVTVLVTARPHRGLPDPRPQAGHRRHDTSRPRAHRQMPAACTADCQRAGPGKRHRRPTAGQDRTATGDGRLRPPG